MSKAAFAKMYELKDIAEDKEEFYVTFCQAKEIKEPALKYLLFWTEAEPWDVAFPKWEEETIGREEVEGYIRDYMDKNNIDEKNLYIKGREINSRNIDNIKNFLAIFDTVKTGDFQYKTLLKRCKRDLEKFIKMIGEYTKSWGRRYSAWEYWRLIAGAAQYAKFNEGLEEGDPILSKLEKLSSTWSDYEMELLNNELKIMESEHGKVQEKLRSDILAFCEYGISIQDQVSTPAQQPAPQPSSVSVHVGKIGDETRSTTVKDSVVQRSSVGEETAKTFSICPYCGEELNLPKTPKFCPYCREQLSG